MKTDKKLLSLEEQLKRALEAYCAYSYIKMCSDNASRIWVMRKKAMKKSKFAM